MKQVLIYVDPNNRLTLKQFNSNRTKRELILTDEDVYFYLDKMAVDTFETIEFVKNGGTITGVQISTNNRQITLHNLHKLKKHEELLAPLTDKMEEELEKGKIRKLKVKRSTKPKVNRENKHSNKHIKIAGLLLTGLLATGAINQHLLMPLAKQQVPDLPKDDSSIVVGTPLEELPKGNEPSIDIVYDIDDNVLENDANTNVDAEFSVEIQPEIQHNELPTVEFDYEDRRNTDKACFVMEEYGDLLTKYATRYGIDPNLMIAIATQERGVHSSDMDPGGATGLMQIQNGVWLGEEISAYNFETGKRDKYIVTNDMIRNLETNIQLGCMYFQNCLDYMHYNIPAAVQCYNMGFGNMGKILNAYSQEQGVSKVDILSDPTDTGWMDYRYLCNDGDELYFEHVSSWLNDNSVTVLNRNNNNNVSINITNSGYRNTL